MSEKISVVPEATNLALTDLFALAKDTGIGPTGFESQHVTVATLLNEIGEQVDLADNDSLSTIIDNSINSTTTTSIAEGDNLYFTETRLRTQVEEETGAYTLVLADADHKWKTVTSESDVNVTIPPQADVAWPDNTYIEFMQGGMGVLTFTGGTGVTVLYNGFLSPRTNGYKAIVAAKRLSEDTWVVFGNLEVNY